MLSVFPELFNYSQMAPVILRIALAAVLFYFGYLSLRAKGNKYGKAEGAAKIIISLFLLAGFLTQIAALLVSLLMAVMAIKEKVAEGVIKRKVLKFLIFAAGIILALLGPGLFAIDLPL